MHRYLIATLIQTSAANAHSLLNARPVPTVQLQLATLLLARVSLADVTVLPTLLRKCASLVVLAEAALLTFARNVASMLIVRLPPPRATMESVFSVPLIILVNRPPTATPFASTEPAVILTEQ
jgi:hypothetical protein